VGDVPSRILPLVHSHRQASGVADLIAEARQMNDRSVRFARGIGQVHTPEHLIPLRTKVRDEYGAQLVAIFHALDETFGTTGASTDYVNAFYAAAEMALMADVAKDRELKPGDRATLRDLWEALLHAG
jgi:hypothetical protein